MTDALPTGEEEREEIDAPPEPEALASQLGLELSPEESAEAEAMVARLRSQFGLDQEEEAEPEPEPPEPEQPEEEEEEPEQPEPLVEPAVEGEFVNIGGRLVPIADARSMMEFRQYLASNPDKAEAVRKAVEGEPQPQPAPAEPEPPEFLDLDDPTQRFMWEQFKAQHGQIAELQRRGSERDAATARERAVNDVQAAMSTFRLGHPELTEDDIAAVRTHAVALDIIDGLSRTRNGHDAVLKALDIAYLDHPDFRAKATGTPSPKQIKAAESKERKQKLAGLAGSSVGATREPEPMRKPETDREMRAAAVQWLTEQNIL
jgi:hypothetical protein